ncbi:MAG: 3-methyl-2-oxobutanoate hydroxymethyltransferase [Planctomycetes bacterium]|nr:3-methyl-2-oxobutanoate hydroxymethyltransferase [Planctomycetota bacterium]
MNHPPLAKSGPKGPWVMLTAYDALMAREAEQGGADLLLVGDSLGKAVLGYDDEKEVMLSDMIHHSQAVMRGVRNIPVVADLPYGTYDNLEVALDSSRQLMALGVNMVKLECDLPHIISHLNAHDIPVMAHLGYTPQTAAKEGSKVVGNEIDSAELLLQESLSVEKAGAVALVLEMVPREVAASIAHILAIPVIGIGSGPDVDGQVLVTTDMWGESDVSFKFLKKFGQISQAKRDAVEAYSAEVRQRTYPADENSFHIKKKFLSTWLNQHPY